MKKKIFVFVGLIIILALFSFVVYFEIQNKLGKNTGAPLPVVSSPTGFI